MTSLAMTLRRSVLHIDPREVSFARRTFPALDSPARVHLEGVASAFLDGYHHAIDTPTVDGLVTHLDAIGPAHRGYAYEGAGMALRLLDLLTPWRGGRTAALLSARGERHTYLIHAGIGFALARLRRPVEPRRTGLDPLLGWLAVDGCGFHEGFFAWHRSVALQVVPRRIRGYARQVFDQGLGRSLWFVHGADPDAIADAIARFDGPRRADLWSGIGLACAYAGGVPAAVVERLQHCAEHHAAHVAQGAAFAAKARQHAEHIPEHTEMACAQLCGMGAGAAAEVTCAMLEDLPTDGLYPAYEIWRQRIRTACARTLGG